MCIRASPNVIVTRELEHHRLLAVGAHVQLAVFRLGEIHLHGHTHIAVSYTHLNALSPLIRSRVEHLFRLQEFGDLHRPPAFHTQLKDTLDHKSGCLVHNPLCSILRSLR